MRIGIDARFSHLKLGIGRYTTEYLKRLVKLDSTNTYVVFVHPNAKLENLPSNFEVVRTRIRWYSLAEQFIFPFLLYSKKLDLVHFPHFNVPLLYRGKYIVTVHDLILLKYPSKKNTLVDKIYYPIKSFLHKLTLKVSLRRAVRVITVSEGSAKDLLEFYPAVKSKLRVIPLASNFSKEENPFKKRNLFIYVGNCYPHKNLEHLVLAFKEFLKEQPDFKLLLIGQEDYFQRKLRQYIQTEHPEILSKVLLLGSVDDDQLKSFYQKATAYITPSFYEGFGLPGLEALTLGTPVIATNVSTHPEIYGQAAKYIDGQDVYNTTKALKDIAANPVEVENLIKKGLEQAEKYSWDKLSEETFRLYILD